MGPKTRPSHSLWNERHDDGPSYGVNDSGETSCLRPARNTFTCPLNRPLNRPPQTMVEEAVFKYLSPVAVGTLPSEDGSDSSPKGVDELSIFPFGAAGRDEPSDWFQSGEDIDRLLGNVDALSWLDDDGGGGAKDPEQEVRRGDRNTIDPPPTVDPDTHTHTHTHTHTLTYSFSLSLSL